MARKPFYVKHVVSTTSDIGSSQETTPVGTFDTFEEARLAAMDHFSMVTASIANDAETIWESGRGDVRSDWIGEYARNPPSDIADMTTWVGYEFERRVQGHYTRHQWVIKQVA